MVRNFLMIAWRNLLRHKTYAVINLIGLSIGMAAALLITLWLNDELTFNRSIPDHDRVVQLMHHWDNDTYGIISTENVMPIPAAGELREKHGEHYEGIALMRPSRHLFSFEDQVINFEGYNAEVDILKILSPKIIAGSGRDFDRADAIMIGQRAAKVLFGVTDPLNQIIILDNKVAVKVIAVFEDFAANTSFAEVDFLQPWSYLPIHQPSIKNSYTHWNDNSFLLYAKLKPRASLAFVNSEINALLEGKPDRDDSPKVFMHPMDSWHLYGEFTNGRNTGGNILYVRLFAVIGVFVLCLACINFMNLSTARAQRRAKEVGIRKTIGSSYRQLVAFFFTESILTVSLAAILALLLVTAALPWFNGMTGKVIQLPYTQLLFWLALLLFVLFTGILAGSYPAFYLSAFNPVKSLKGIFLPGSGANRSRMVLVVMQFTVSMVLIIGTVVVYQQVQHAKNRSTGYKAEGLITVEMRTDEFYDKRELLEQELLASGAVANVAAASNSMMRFRATFSGFDWKGKDPNLDPEFDVSYVTTDFGKTVGWQFIDGRDFSTDYATDTAAMILNEAAARLMQLDNPVNETVKLDPTSFQVVGVIKNVVMSSPFKSIMPAIYMLTDGRLNTMTIRLNPRLAPNVAIANVEAVFKKHIPSVPFYYSFVDEDYAKKFAMEERVGRIASCFAAFALLISCMGVFGLAVFMAEQRTKEIGVRKVLGASISSVWALLSANFLKLTFISVLLALPLSFYLIKNWLDSYDYRIALSPWLFALTSLGLCLITLVTVSFQTIKAARMNPVKALRDE